METKENVNKIIPSIFPKEEIYIKLSFPSVVISESYTSTLYILEEAHIEKISKSDVRAVFTFQYTDPEKNIDIYKLFNITVTAGNDNSQVADFFHLYMSVNVAREFYKMLKASINQEHCSNISEGLTLYFPEAVKDGYKYEEEHSELNFKSYAKEGDFLRYIFSITGKIKKEEFIKGIIQNIASEDGFKEVHILLNKIASSVLIKHPDIAISPDILTNSAEDMIIKMNNIEKLGNGYVRIPSDPSKEILLITMKLGEIEGFVKVMDDLFTYTH